MPVSARVQPVSPLEAVLVVLQEDGSWKPFLRHRGPDAEARCEATRRELEAGTFDHEGRLPERDRGPGNRAQTPIGGGKRATSDPWTVALPASLRPLFESLAVANGSTPEVQLVAYLESDDFLRDLAADAARRAS